MTKKKVEKKKVIKSELEPSEFLKSGEDIHTPSQGFSCLGIWPRAIGSGVIVAGVDPYYGPLIGLIGSGYGGALGDLTWVSITRDDANSVRALAESEKPVGLCGDRTINGNLEEDVWVTFSQEDLDSLSEATKMISDKLI